MSDFYKINELRRITSLIAIYIANITEPEFIEQTRIEDSTKIEVKSSRSFQETFTENKALEIAREFVRHVKACDGKFCTYAGYQGIVPCDYMTCVRIDGIAVIGVQYTGGAIQFMINLMQASDDV